MSKSGRLRGRPKGSQNKKTIWKKIANESHLAPKGYGTKYCNAIELLFLLLRQKAVEGDTVAIKKIEEYSEFIPPAQEMELALDFSTSSKAE